MMQLIYSLQYNCRAKFDKSSNMDFLMRVFTLSSFTIRYHKTGILNVLDDMSRFVRKLAICIC